MEFISSNWQDIDRYYNGTFIKLQEFGEKLFHIQSVNAQMVTGVDEDQNYFELLLDDNYPYTVDYVLPHKSVFQYKDNALMLQRIPARQYRRGLCSNNTQIMNLSTNEKITLQLAHIKAFVNKQQNVPFSEAFKSKMKAKSIALSARMWFNRANAAIVIDNTVVATYNYETKKIRMVHPIFLPEIMQHMVDHNESYEVEK